MSTCRLCLYESEEGLISIWDNDIEDLPTKILNCVSLNVMIEDNLPSTVCISCIEQITNWETFKNNCHKSNELLLESCVEVVETDFEIFVVDDFDEDVKVLKQEPIELKTETADTYLNPDHIEIGECQDDLDYLRSEFLNSIKSNFSEGFYQCQICSTEFDTCFEYLDHQETHNGEKVFICDKCPEVFTLRQQLVDHDRNHRAACPLCGKIILKTSMSLHLIKHTNKFKCSKCESRFNSKAGLCQHIVTVHTDIKDHVCETCGKRFSSQTSMRVHLKSHSSKRLYPCKLCSYAGRTASAIYVHMSTHSNEITICEICSKTFKSTRNLNDHLRRVHSKEKKHQCTYCKKKFVDKYMLSVHTRSHTGVRPYKCKICDKTFIRADSLKEHLTIHGKRVIQKCSKCTKPFASKRGLVRHNCTSLT